MHMNRVFVSGVLAGGLVVFAATLRPAAQPAKGGYLIQHDADIQKAEPGTHNGGGHTLGYSFFDQTPGMHFVFRKRAFKPGSGVGTTNSTRTRSTTSSADTAS